MFRVATNSGIYMFEIDAQGEKQHSGQFSSEALQTRIPLSATRTVKCRSATPQPKTVRSIEKKEPCRKAVTVRYTVSVHHITAERRV
jgi:hypothetical protein